PTRTSISQWKMVKPFGPHQRATCSGRVHALNTRARGASMTRVMTSSRCCMSVSTATSLLLALQLLQVVLEPVEALFPEHAVVLQPVGCALQRARLEPAGAPLRLAPAGDEPGALQHLQVLGDRRQAHRERLGEFRNRSLA